jgi:hypothetical protein
MRNLVYIIKRWIAETFCKEILNGYKSDLKYTTKEMNRAFEGWNEALEQVKYNNRFYEGRIKEVSDYSNRLLIEKTKLKVQYDDLSKEISGLEEENRKLRFFNEQ